MQVNINHYLKIKLVGLRAGSSKNNYFGIGSKIEVRSGDQYQMKTVTEPITYFGLGARPVADVVRIQWTNGVPQNIYFPEEQVGMQLSKFLLSSNILNYTKLNDKMSIAELLAPDSFIGKTLQELALPTDHGVNIVAIKTENFSVGEEGENIINDEINSMPGANDIVKTGDVLILSGEQRMLNKLILSTR